MDVTKTKKKICIFSKKIYIVNLSQFLSPNVLWSCNVHGQLPERSDIFTFSGLSLWRRSNSEKLTRFKIAADTLMTFAGEFFTEVAIMLFNLKSVLYPPDVTVINRRR